jgi:predicted DNA-binding transcriptional regulator AlpA
VDVVGQEQSIDTGAAGFQFSLNLEDCSDAEVLAINMASAGELATRLRRRTLTVAAPAAPASAEPVAMLTRKQVALRLQISLSTLRRMKADFPKPTMTGAKKSRPRWSADEIANWQKQAKRAA